MGIFSKYVEGRILREEEAIEGRPILDMFEFIGGVLSGRLNIPIPVSLILKVYYNLVEKYPLTDDEWRLVDLMAEEFDVYLDVENIPEFIKVLVLCIGRRGYKTTAVSFIYCYEIYKLIYKGNPHAYYGVPDDESIMLMNVATSEDQAKTVFDMTAAKLKNSPELSQYLDPNIDSSIKLGLFTPTNILENERIKERNRGKLSIERENLRKGSIVVCAAPTTSKGIRSKNPIVVSFDEFAHFQRSSVVATGDMGMYTSSELMGSDQSDLAMFRALSPSVKNFGRDGKIITLSTPREEGGEFHKLYDMGKEPDRTGYVVFQFATWDVNERIEEEDLKDEFDSDPIGASMEYGARFQKPSASFMPAEKLDAIRVEDVPVITSGDGVKRFVITLDPAGVKPGATRGRRTDVYSIAWGYHEHILNRDYFWIAGMHGFMPTRSETPEGALRIEPVDSLEVTQFVADLAESLGGVVEICYDQWESSMSTSFLQKLRLPAFETTFTDSYKHMMYSSFIQQLNYENIYMYGIEASPMYNWGEVAISELKHLQRIIRGSKMRYTHPASGPVQSDDFADVCANLIHRLVLLANPSKQTALEKRRLMKKHGLQIRGAHAGPLPVGLSNVTRPVIGPGLTGYTSPASPKKSNRNPIAGRTSKGRGR